MGVKNGDVGERAWKILRLALLWARKGGVLKRRLVMEMRLVPKYLRRLAHTTNTNAPPNQLYYCERQLSFDNTPIFPRPSSMRFHIPCINPHVDFDYDFEQDHCHATYEDEGIDVRAEEFIAKFYHQIKLQRQISYLQYHQTPTTDSP